MDDCKRADINRVSVHHCEVHPLTSRSATPREKLELAALWGTALVEHFQLICYPGSGGGNLDDILKRLSNVETAVSEVRTQVGAISALIPHLATKPDLTSVETSVSEVRAIIPHLATKADLLELKASVASIETAIIKWMIATVLASTTLAFTVAKFVH